MECKQYDRVSLFVPNVNLHHSTLLQALHANCCTTWAHNCISGTLHDCLKQHRRILLPSPSTLPFTIRTTFNSSSHAVDHVYTGGCLSQCGQRCHLRGHHPQAWRARGAAAVEGSGPGHEAIAGAADPVADISLHICWRQTSAADDRIVLVCLCVMSRCHDMYQILHYMCTLAHVHACVCFRCCPPVDRRWPVPCRGSSC